MCALLTKNTDVFFFFCEIERVLSELARNEVPDLGGTKTGQLA